MKVERLLLIAVFIITGASSCKMKPGQEKKIDLISNPNIKLHDTAFEKFYQGVWFSPHVVRLDNNKKPAFIQVDSAYFNTKHVDAQTRDEYYKKVIALLPKQEVEVHRRIWAIPEMRELQQGNGGSGTVLTSIKEVLDEKSGYYLVELKRNDVEQLNPVNTIAGFRIRLRPLVIDVGDESGYFVPLESWRKNLK